MVSNEIFEMPPSKGRKGAGSSSNGLRCRYLCLGNIGVSIRQALKIFVAFYFLEFYSVPFGPLLACIK
jgi:hypothetical protein